MVLKYDLLLGLIALCFSCNQTEKRAVDGNGIDSTGFFSKAIVKSQIRWKCDSVWTKTEKEEEKEFDEKGNLVKWIQYTSAGSICDKFKYEYEGARKVKEYRVNCLSDFDANSIKILKYDPKGRLEEENEFESNELKVSSRFKFKTNEDKYPYLREVYFDGEGEPTSVTNLIFDRFGNILEEEQLVSGSWFGTHTYKFNSVGQLIYETGEVDGGVGLVEYFYIYENGLLAKDSVKVPDTGMEYHVYELKKFD